MDGQMAGLMDGGQDEWELMNKWMKVMDGHGRWREWMMDGWMKGWTEERIDGWKDGGWMDG